MLVENLIDQLMQFRKGTNVCLYDVRKNMADDIGVGSSAGVYPDFEISMMELGPDEQEYYKEQNGKEHIPWIAISFENDDRDPDGSLNI